MDACAVNAAVGRQRVGNWVHIYVYEESFWVHIYVYEERNMLAFYSAYGAKWPDDKGGQSLGCCTCAWAITWVQLFSRSQSPLDRGLDPLVVLRSTTLRDEGHHLEPCLLAHNPSLPGHLDQVHSAACSPASS